MGDKIWDALTWLASQLWPPVPVFPRTKEQTNLYRWHVNVTLCLYVGIAMYTFLFVTLMGLLPIGFPTFALANDVRADQMTLQRSLDMTHDGLGEIQLGQVKRDLRDTAKNYCLALQSKNQAAVDLYWGDLQDLRVRYLTLAKIPYDFPECKSILVSSQ